MPDPSKILTTIRRAADLMRATPGRSGGIITLAEAAEVMVVGDLHGNISAFKQVLAISALDRHPGRHLVLQELIHGPFTYGDGKGDRSHQLLDVFTALKCQYAARVHHILGNHELSELTGRSIGKDGEGLNVKFRRGVDTAYGATAGEIYEAYKALFQAFPLAVRTANRVYVCHTIPDERDLGELDIELLKADSWPEEAMKRRGTIYALTWGRDTSPETADRFAEMVDADWFVTGHQPCDLGFRQANHRQIIIDGTNPYPCYCLFPASEPLTIETLVSCVHRIDASDGIEDS
jgi:Calcineurin-like phosphoesterase